MTRVAFAAVLSAAWLGGAAAPEHTVLAVAGRSNGNPSIAAAGAFVAVSWVASGEGARADVYMAASADAGQTFASPVLVSGSAGADVSGEQPPRVVLSPQPGRAPAVAIVWTSKGAAGTRLLSVRSDDGGRRFSTPSPVAGSDAPGNRGWESVAVTPAGDAFAIWLDHRELAPAGRSMNHAEHQDGARAEDGAVRAQRSKLWFGAVGGNDAVRDVAARPVAAGVCYCCKTALAATDGRFYAAWRHVYPGNVRDIAFTMSDDGGRTFAPPVRVSDDDWVLDGCPENGPSVAVDRTNTIHVVWATLVQGDAGAEPSMKLFYAMSRDGKSFTTRQPLPTNDAPRHPQLAAEPSGHIAVVWDEQAEGVRRIVAARGATDGTSVRFTRDVITEDRGTYPAIAPLADGALIAWTSGPVERSVLRITQRSPAQSR
jgi:hypothetical protein